MAIDPRRTRRSAFIALPGEGKLQKGAGRVALFPGACRLKRIALPCAAVLLPFDLAAPGLPVVIEELILHALGVNETEDKNGLLPFLGRLEINGLSGVPVPEHVKALLGQAVETLRCPEQQLFHNFRFFHLPHSRQASVTGPCVRAAGSR